MYNVGMHYYRRNSDSAIQKALEGVYHRPSRSRYEEPVEEAENSVGDPTSQEEVLIQLMEAYRASDDDPAAQRAIMQRIRSFATRNNPVSYCQCGRRPHARNPYLT